ncbi:hypothetical protein TNCV_30571 [Trichonephila clavipes]|nr:hypothetical protein TNCV_30571 [Trichonephila clavipes]
MGRGLGMLDLQTFMPPPEFELRPYGTAVSVTNHFTGWETGKHVLGVSQASDFLESWALPRDGGCGGVRYATETKGILAL